MNFMNIYVYFNIIKLYIILLKLNIIFKQG